MRKMIMLEREDLADGDLTAIRNKDLQKILVIELLVVKEGKKRLWDAVRVRMQKVNCGFLG